MRSRSLVRSLFPLPSLSPLLNSLLLPPYASSVTSIGIEPTVKESLMGAVNERPSSPHIVYLTFNVSTCPRRDDPLTSVLQAFRLTPSAVVVGCRRPRRDGRATCPTDGVLPVLDYISRLDLSSIGLSSKSSGPVGPS